MSTDVDPAAGTQTSPSTIANDSDLPRGTRILLLKLAIAQRCVDEPEHPALQRCATVVKVAGLLSYAGFITAVLLSVAVGGRVGVAYGVGWGIGAMMVVATVASLIVFSVVQRLELRQVRAIFLTLDPASDVVVAPARMVARGNGPHAS